MSTTILLFELQGLYVSWVWMVDESLTCGKEVIELLHIYLVEM